MRLLANLVCAVFIIQAAPTRAEERQAVEQLIEAAAKATMHDGVRYAFTVDHWSRENGKEREWKASFDPRRAVGEQWRMVGVESDNLDKDGRKTLERLQKIENADDPLVYDKLGELLDGVVLQSETYGEAVFVAPLEDEDLPTGVMEAVIILNKIGGYVSQIDVRSVSEFKPNAMVKLKSMRQSQQFAAPTGDGPAFLVKNESAAQGNAMFKKFDSQRREIISNVEAIDAPELPASQD